VRVRYLQHVPYEGVGSIRDWAGARRHDLSGTLLSAGPHESPGLPTLDAVDFLVVMGGPMNVYEHDAYPWLVAEKDFICSCIGAGKPVLGICLGAQLIADALGGEVTRAPYEEIGWYPVELTAAGRELPVFSGFPDRFTALHWHGDMFSIPAGAVHVASSAACPNQAFSYDGGRVVGLQFHLEETRESLAELVEAAGQDLPEDAAAETIATGPGETATATVATAPVARTVARGPWVSVADDLFAPDAPIEACREMLFGLLDRMVVG
jgi:GMP synthase-like glutamine amidotransferase